MVWQSEKALQQRLQEAEEAVAAAAEAGNASAAVQQQLYEAQQQLAELQGRLQSAEVRLVPVIVWLYTSRSVARLSTITAILWCRPPQARHSRSQLRQWSSCGQRALNSRRYSSSSPPAR